MFSTIQRLNHLASISTTFVLVLLGLISAASFLTQPAVEGGKIEVSDLVVRRGRIQRWNARDEDVASLRFDLKVDLQNLLTSYNVKQLFVYLTAAYDDDVTGEHHEVTLWDDIITRADTRDFRAVGQKTNLKSKKAKKAKSRKGRGKINLEHAKMKRGYNWRNPGRSFENIHHANVTLHYSIMPYVGLVTTGVAATAEGLVDIPPVKRA